MTRSGRFGDSGVIVENGGSGGSGGSPVLGENVRFIGKAWGR